MRQISYVRGPLYLVFMVAPIFPFARALLWILADRMHVVNCHQNTEAADLLGGLRPLRGRDRLAQELRERSGEFLRRCSEATRRLSHSHRDIAVEGDVVADDAWKGGDVIATTVTPVVAVDKMGVDGLTTVIQVHSKCFLLVLLVGAFFGGFGVLSLLATCAIPNA